MKERVLNFQGYLRIVNESSSTGAAPFVKPERAPSEIKSATFDIDRYKEMVKNGTIKMIDKGPKTGTPTVNYFSPKEGNIVKQIDNLYQGTEFADKNPIPALSESESFLQDIDEDKVPLDYTLPGGKTKYESVGPQELVKMITSMYNARQKQIARTIEADPSKKYDAIPFDGASLPLFVFGAPGIGKTQLVGQACQKLGIDLLTLDVQNMSLEDFKGIPKPIDVEPAQYDTESGRATSIGKGVTRYNYPAALPAGNGSTGKGGIIFLDEMNRTKNPALYGALMQFIQQGRIDDPKQGGYLLPHGWCIVAAGNRPELDTVGSGRILDLDIAQTSRFSNVNYRPETGAWAEFMMTKYPDLAEIIKFVERNEDLFYNLDTDEESGVFGNPRSWDNLLSSIQNEIEDSGYSTWRQIPPGELLKICKIKVGAPAALGLNGYLDILRNFNERELEEMVVNPEKAKKLTGREKNFTDVAFGLGEALIKKAEQIGGGEGKASDENLQNIITYYLSLDGTPGYEEIATAIYTTIRDRYPEFSIEFILQKRDSLESDLRDGKITKEEFDQEVKKLVPKIQAAKKMVEEMKKRGLY